MEAKTPDDIYKAHLIDSRTPSSANVDSARQNLAATFVNGLVNAGFGADKLMTGTGEEASSSSAPGGSGSWLFKNKEHGKTSAAASVVRYWSWLVSWNVPQGSNDGLRFLVQVFYLHMYAGTCRPSCLSTVFSQVLI
jgi:26S proteasome regulatory subunit N1